MSTRYYVLLNRKWIGIVETNYAFACAYWAARCRPSFRFTLTQEVQP